jgi:hypothetical protein
MAFSAFISRGFLYGFEKASRGNQMKPLIAIILLLALGACGEGKRQDLAECRTKAIKVYPNWQRDSMAGQMGDFTFLCMESKGYVSSQTCPTGAGWLNETEEGCYRKVWPWE